MLRGGALLDRGARERACDAAERAADGVATAAAHGGADGGAGDRAADAAERAVGAFDRHLFDAGDRTVVDRLLGAGAVAGVGRPGEVGRAAGGEEEGGRGDREEGETGGGVHGKEF